MRKALAALTLSVFAFVVSIVPGSAQQGFDPFEDYIIPNDGVYEAMLSMAITAGIFLMLLTAILVLIAITRKEPPRQ